MEDERRDECGTGAEGSSNEGQSEDDDEEDGAGAEEDGAAGVDVASVGMGWAIAAVRVPLGWPTACIACDEAPYTLPPLALERQ